MPQLDLITFIDQTFYVYTFFIIQYMIISVCVLPGLYQSIAIRRLIHENILADIQSNIVMFKQSLLLLDSAEMKFENRLKV